VASEHSGTIGSDRRAEALIKGPLPPCGSRGTRARNCQTQSPRTAHFAPHSVDAQAMKSLIGDDRPKRLPSRANEAHHPKFLDHTIINPAGVDGQARQRQIEFYLLQICSLSHDALSREFVAALLQHLHHQFGGAVAICREDAFPVTSRVIAVHEHDPSLHSFVVPPGGIPGLLERTCRDQSLCILDARGR
jgi:hypothetical protein